MPLLYSDVRQKSSHNSYYQDEGLFDQFLFWRIHSLELDINIQPQHAAVPEVGIRGVDGPPPSTDVEVATEGEWFIYENQNRTNVNRLSDAMEVLKAIHNSEPAHQVITVFLCLKDPLQQPGYTPDVLDGIVARFGEALGNVVYLPADRKAAGQWPALADLTGKFIFGLTGNPFVSDYATYQGTPAGSNASIFLAPELLTLTTMPSSADFVAAFQKQWPTALLANISFYDWSNTPSLNDLPDRLAEVGIVSRAYPRTGRDFNVTLVDDLDNAGDWAKAEQAGFHHIATNRINVLQDPFSCTNAANGWPFELRHGPTPAVVPPGNPLVRRIDATSGDIDGGTDSFVFAYNQFGPANVNRNAVYYIGSPNSSVEGWAKGGLMARASLDPDADYFAILRPADDHPFQVQWRKKGYYKEVSFGNNTDMKMDGFQIGLDTLVFARLAILNAGYRAAAYVALFWEGGDTGWILIDEELFDTPLAFQGLAASSHGDSMITFQFGDLGTAPSLGSLTLQSIGAASNGSSQLDSYITGG